MSEPVTVQCGECGKVANVVGCARFACPRCGRVALTATGSIHHAFAVGWAAGAAGTASETVRETEKRYPGFGPAEVTAYLNGAEDGARGDRFRLDMRP